MTIQLISIDFAPILKWPVNGTLLATPSERQFLCLWLNPSVMCLTDFQLQIRVWFFSPHWCLLLSSLRNSKTFSQFCLFWTLWVAWDEVIKFGVFVIKGRSTAWYKVTVAINLSRMVTLSPTLLLTPPRATLKLSCTWRVAHVQIATS